MLPQQPRFYNLLARVKPLALVCLLLLLVGVFSYTRAHVPARVYAATSSNLNFQGRLQSNSGAIVPDGNYHIEFKLYSVSSGGAALWTETRSTGNLVRVVNGYFTVNLGSVTAFPSTINWDQEHWLTMNVGGSGGSPSYDGEMTPRLKLTATPYAFSAGQLRKTVGANTAILDFLNPTANRLLNLPDQDGTLCIQGSPDCVDVATTGTTAATSSNSGLEISADGLRLLGGCADGQMMRWNDTSEEWECSSGTGSSFTVRESDGSPSTTVSNALEFGPGTNSDTEFIVSNEGGGVTRIRIGTSILTTGNYGSTLDSVYVNESQSPAAGDVSGSFSAGLSVNSVQNNSVDLGTDTVGDYVQNLGTLVGLSTSGNSGEGSTPGLSVLYGSSANTAVQGNTTLVCPSGTGNLTGGGNTITLGAGGSCGAISTNAAVSFGTSVTTPLLTNVGTLSITSTATGGADDIIFSNAGSESLRILENGDFKFERGTDDAFFSIAAPSGAPATYTFSGATGTVLTTANFGTNLDGTYVNVGESPAAGDVSGSFTAGLSVNDVQNNAVDLGAETVGDYVQNLGALVGLSTSGNSGEGSTPGLSVLYGSSANTAVQGNTALICASGTGDLSGGGNTITLGLGGTCGAITISEAPVFDTSVTTPLLTYGGALTIQTTATGGADDLIFKTAGTEILRFLENGSLFFERGTNDATIVVNTPSGAPATYTFDGASGTVLTTANYIGSLDGTYVNVGESPAAGDVSGSFSAGLSVNDVQNNAVDLGAETVGDYVQNLGTLVGLSTSGNSGEGSTPGLSVLYGSGANNAAAGANTFTCASGTGNLTGGGTVVTIGTSGTTCAAITTNAAVSFATSVATPLLTNAGLLTIQTTATAGTDDIVFNTIGSERLRLLETGGISVTGGIDNNSGGITEAGSITGVGTNITASGALTVASTGGANALTLTSGSGTVVLGSSTLQNSASAFTFDLANAGTSTFSISNSNGSNVAGLDVEGAINAGNGNAFQVNTDGDITSVFTILDGSSTTNGTSGLGTSTSLVLNNAANFDVGNYVQVSDTNCGGTGINPCYAKITAKASNTLTITPALRWTNAKAVTEYHVPELGGTDLTSTLANRYGRGYFIAGVATGNGTTYYNEDSIETSLDNFDLLNTNVTTLNIGGAATSLNIGNTASTINILGSLQTSGSETITAGGGLIVSSGGAIINGGVDNNSGGITETGTVSGVTGITFTSGGLNLASGGITNAGTIAGASTIDASGLITGVGLTAGSGLIQGTGGLTITGAISFDGSLSDPTGNLVLDDIVDIGSTTTGLRVTTDGSLLDIDGNLVLDDQLALGSATTGLQITTDGLITDLDDTSITFGENVTVSAGGISVTGNSTITGTLVTYSAGYNVFAAGTNLNAYGYFRSVDSSDSVSRFELGAYDLTGASQGARALVLNPLGGNVGIGGDLTPDALFSVGSTSQFQIDANGLATSVGLTAGSGLIQGTGGLTISGAVSLDGALSDPTGNLVLDDIVDIGSTTTGLRVGTDGSILDIDGALVLNDELNLGSASTGLLVTIDGLITDLDDASITFGENLTVTTGGITVTGNSTITGTLSGLTGLTVASGGASITGGANNNDGGITNTGVISGTTYIDLKNNVANPAYAEGRLFYDNTQKALSYYNSEAAVTLNIGQENYIYVYNSTGSTITDGQAVYINGTNAGVPMVALARADNSTTANAIGVATHSIENNTFGYITNFGEVNDLNTAGLTAGASLYLSAATAGALTDVRPAQPNYTVPIGRVTQVHGSTGKIVVIMGSQRSGAAPVGALAFGSADGSLINDSALFWDNTNKRLGIGDATPLATLTVGNGDLFQVAGATGAVITSGLITGNGGLTIVGAVSLDGAVSDPNSNLVLDDTVDIGSAVNGIRVATDGSILDINGDLVLNDQVIVGSSSTGLQITTGGVLSDLDANIVLDDTVDIGSAANGIRVATDGSIIDINGDLILNDQLNLGSSTIGLLITTDGAITDIDDASVTFGENLAVSAGGISITGNSTIAGSLGSVTTLNTSGLITGTGGLTITGAAVSLNDSSNFAVNIGTGTSTGAVTIGGGSNTFAVASTGLDISTAGAITNAPSLASVNNTNLTLDAAGTGSLVFTGYNCSTQSNGGALTTNASGVVACSADDSGISDSRLKKNVTSLDESILDKLKDVRTVTFDFDCDQQFFDERVLDCLTTRQTGVIAQELAQVFPELVYQAEDGYYRVKYDALSIYNLKAVTEIAKHISSDGGGNFNTLTVNGVLEAGTIRADHIEGLDYIGRFESLEERVSTLEQQQTADNNQPASEPQQEIDLENLTAGNFTTTGATTLNGTTLIKGEASFDKKAAFSEDVTINGQTDVQSLSVNMALIAKGTLDVNGTATFKEMVRFEKDVSFEGNITAAGAADLQQLTVSLDLIAKGALIVEGPATFKEMVRFEKDVSFEGNVAVKGQATFNSDTAGTVELPAGEMLVKVEFSKPQTEIPIISLTLGDGKFAQYSYRNVTKEGFEIVVKTASDEPLNFSWIALQAQPKEVSIDSE